MNNLNQFLNSWKYHRKQTLDLLKNLHRNKLKFFPGKGLGSLEKQFRHLANIEHCYIEAMNSKKMNFSKKIYGKEFNSKEKLIKILEIEDKNLMKIVKGLKNKDVKRIVYWGGEHNPTILEHLSWLIDHEVMHHGQLIVYYKLLRLKFPKSWKDWGL